MLRALACGGQGLFDYSANPPWLCVVLGPLGSDLEALSEICRGGRAQGKSGRGHGLTSWSAPRSEAHEGPESQPRVRDAGAERTSSETQTQSPN